MLVLRWRRTPPTAGSRAAPIAHRGSRSVVRVRRNEQPLFTWQDLDPESSTFAVNDHHGIAASGTDLIEHRLARNAELSGGVIELHIAVGNRRDEMLADLVGEPDPPRRVLSRLLRRE